MGRADSDKSGGSGNKGGGGGSSGGGGSGGESRGAFGNRNRSGGYVDNDSQRADVERDHTAGNQNDAQAGENSRQGSSRNGATGGNRGSPAAPDGRGTNTPGSPASRARDAMARHERAREQTRTTEQAGLVGDNLGVGEGYSHPDAIAERAKTGTVSPTEMDMAMGYAAGKRGAMAKQAVGAVAAPAVGRISGVPQAGAVARSGIGELAGGMVSTSASEYGASVARSRAKNTMAQDVAQAAAGFAGGPVGGMVAGMANTAINDHRTRDIDRMSEALGFNQGGSTMAGSGNGTTASGGMIGQAQAAAQTPALQPFEWKPVDINRYTEGLLSLAQTP